jgi:hypothetical protein
MLHGRLTDPYRLGIWAALICGVAGTGFGEGAHGRSGTSSGGSATAGKVLVIESAPAHKGATESFPAEPSDAVAASAAEAPIAAEPPSAPARVSRAVTPTREIPKASLALFLGPSLAGSETEATRADVVSLARSRSLSPVPPRTSALTAPSTIDSPPRVSAAVAPPVSTGVIAATSALYETSFTYSAGTASDPSALQPVSLDTSPALHRDDPLAADTVEAALGRRKVVKPAPPASTAPGPAGVPPQNRFRNVDELKSRVQDGTVTGQVLSSGSVRLALGAGESVAIGRGAIYGGKPPPGTRVSPTKDFVPFSLANGAYLEHPNGNKDDRPRGLHIFAGGTMGYFYPAVKPSELKQFNQSLSALNKQFDKLDFTSKVDLNGQLQALQDAASRLDRSTSLQQFQAIQKQLEALQQEMRRRTETLVKDDKKDEDDKDKKDVAKKPTDGGGTTPVSASMRPDSA